MNEEGCVTHHLACNCREAKFKKLIEAAKYLKQEWDGWGTIGNAFKKLIEALKDLEEISNG